MHKNDEKCEVDKVADEEEAKQRKFRAILNKLTPQKFEKLFKKVIVIGIDNAKTELLWNLLYFYYHLSGELLDFREDVLIFYHFLSRHYLSYHFLSLYFFSHHSLSLSLFHTHTHTHIIDKYTT